MADARVILSAHGVITKFANGKHISAYLSRLKHVYYSKKGMPKRFTLYKTTTQRNGTTILVMPRDAIAELMAVPGMTLRNSLPAPHYSRALPARGELAPFLYDDQKILVSEIMRHMITSPTGTASLNLRAGYGKTFIAGGLIYSLGVRTLYVVPTRELAKQTVDDLGAILPDGANARYVDASDELVKIANGENKECDVCVAVINTVLIAAQKCGTARMSAAFSLAILDEVHTYCSQKRSEIFWIAQTNFMFGMSATIGDRRDGFDFAIAHHLPPLIDAAQVRGFSYGENPFTLHVHAIRFKARADFAQNLRHETTGEIFTHYMYEQFARDDERNELVAHCARELYARGHNTFIFVEERAHAEKLRDCVVRYIPQDEIVLFYGGTSEETRALAIAEDGARVIIATFSYCGTGISIVRMSAMILASPRYSNMKQIVGRILRRGSDATIVRDVIDIVDYKTCLARQFRIRQNAYDYYGAKYDVQNVKSGEHAAYGIMQPEA